MIGKNSFLNTQTNVKKLSMRGEKRVICVKSILEHIFNSGQMNQGHI